MQRARIGAMTPGMSKWCLTLFLLVGCSSEGPTPGNPSCTLKPATACPSPAPTYAEVSALFDAHCNGCHGGLEGVWPLTDYDSVSAWQVDIRGELLDCSMPPADAGTVMTDAEKTKILQWLRCGLPK